MDRKEFEKLLIPIVEIIDDIELDMIKNMIKRIDNYSGVKGSLEWYTDKLVELKLLEKDNKKVFKKNKQELKNIVEEIAKKCGGRIDNLDKLKEYYERGRIKKDPTLLYNSPSINKVIKNAIKDTDDIMDIIQTKAIEGAKISYKNVLNKAYIETAGGVYTYTESIKRTIDEFSEQGISAVHYTNGKKISIETVTRRDVITRMNKLVGDVEIEHAKELDTNLVYVDQHLGARTRTKYTKEDYEAHDEWQGKKYMIVGSNDKYDNLYEKTGYGEMLGFKGINCYHNMRPTFEWEEIDEVIDIEESKKVREILDRRNYYARKLRILKRKREAYKVTNPKDVSKVNRKIEIASKEYDNFLKDNDMVRDYSREYTSNNANKNLKMNSSNTEQVREYKETKIYLRDKIVDLNEEIILEKFEQFKDYTIDKNIEHSYIITKEGDLFELIGTKGEIQIPNWLNLDGAYGIHNHPIKETMFGFSSKDIDLFLRGKMNRFDGFDEKYQYSLQRTKDTMYGVSSQEILNFWKKERNKALSLAHQGKLDMDTEQFDYITKSLADKYKIKYERIWMKKKN